VINSGRFLSTQRVATGYFSSKKDGIRSQASQLSSIRQVLPPLRRARGKRPSLRSMFQSPVPRLLISSIWVLTSYCHGALETQYGVPQSTLVWLGAEVFLYFDHLEYHSCRGMPSANVRSCHAPGYLLAV
jgi:hypothetical protein